MIANFAAEYERYKIVGERALAQIPDEALNQMPYTEGNSAAMIVRHLSGNFLSRFTDFLTTDGEKPWRDREAEFANVEYTRQQVNEHWAQGWAVIFNALQSLRDEDQSTQVTIRSVPLTVHEALCRSLAHVAMHVGQIIVLARFYHQGAWQSLSIPKGESAQYNANPTKEKRP